LKLNYFFYVIVGVLLFCGNKTCPKVNQHKKLFIYVRYSFDICKNANSYVGHGNKKKKTTNDAPDQIIQIKNVINPERTGLPPFLKTV
jgi:hypothetical protein